jgi:hypothetical protein
MDGNSTGHIHRTPPCERAKTATAERYAACVAVATMLEAAAARENESQREAVGREAKTRSELKTLECQLKQAELAADRGHRHLAFVRQCLDSVNDEKNRCVADVKRGEVSLQAAEVACTFAIETEGTAARAQMVAAKAAAVARPFPGSHRRGEDDRSTAHFDYMDCTLALYCQHHCNRSTQLALRLKLGRRPSRSSPLDVGGLETPCLVCYIHRYELGFLVQWS